MGKIKITFDSRLQVWQSDGRLGGLDNVEYGKYEAKLCCRLISIYVLIRIRHSDKRRRPKLRDWAYWQRRVVQGSKVSAKLERLFVSWGKYFHKQSIHQSWEMLLQAGYRKLSLEELHVRTKFIKAIAHFGCFIATIKMVLVMNQLF